MEKEEDQIKDDSRALAIRHNDMSTGLRVLNLLDEKQLAAAEVFLKRLISTDKGGIKTVAEGIAILTRAQDLALPFSTCIEHIHVINGKTGIDVHIIKTLLLRAGITWNCTKKYLPQYQYTDGNTIYNETQLPDYCVKCRSSKEAEECTNNEVVGVYPLAWFQDLKGNIYSENQVSDKCVRAINKVHALKLASEGKFPVIRIPAQPIDYVTEYCFQRDRVIGGKKTVMTVYSEFSYSDAAQAGLLDKDNYKKFPKIMISHRAFVLGARDIADDVLMGCYSIEELNDINNIDVVDAVVDVEDYVDITNNKE